MDIDRKREELRKLAANNFDIDMESYQDAEPYDYDFKVLTQYGFDPEFTPMANNVEFVEHGAYVSVPIDYLEAVTVRKEEPDA